ncbi:MAG: glycoside hydrolase family 3 C-terminal domain-containing protein [Terriglobales bacterium]|jgi:beta-glucosidase
MKSREEAGGYVCEIRSEELSNGGISPELSDTRHRAFVVTAKTSRVASRAPVTAFGVVLFTLSSWSCLAWAQASGQPWTNTRLSPDERADLVVKQMTLDEKIQLVHGSMAMLGKKIPGALGGDGFVPGIPRLGIPDLNLIGAGVGVTNLGRRSRGMATALPSSLAETATWDPKLAYDFGAVIGRETRDQGFNVSLGGGNDIMREPRNGRNFEYHGEDPVLAGTIIGQELRAIQDQGVIADIKHYALNCQETDRMGVSSNLDKRSLRELDLLAFEIGIRDSGVGSVMCAYNRVNGVYSCENDYLLNEVLKKDWGFKGWVMSDWGATHSTVQAALAGLDQEFFENKYFAAPLEKAVESGAVPLSRLDDMVHRILRTMFAFGVIDNPPVIRPIDAEAGAAVAQRVEEQGAVLLKNAGNELPLSASNLHSIVVIGSHADVGVLSGGGSAQVEPVGGNAVPPKEIPSGPTGFLAVWVWDPSSALRAIRAKAPNAKVSYDGGTDPAAAAKAARGADVAIVFVYQQTHEGDDLANLSLPDKQDELVRQVAAANSRTVVVLENGDPVLMPWLNNVKAVLESWYPGQRGGEAIAKILFGDVNPSGKLPISFPKSEVDLPHLTIPGPPPSEQPSSSDLLPTPTLIDANYTEGLEVGYRWYDAEKREPLFPFGFGLSYTTFSYSQLKVDSGKSVEVSFSVQNTGLRAGAEVAQVYLGLPASAGEPPKRLVAWEKVSLDPGQSRTLTISLGPKSMSVFNVKKDAWEVLPGDYLVSVGGSSRQTPLSATVAIP